MFPMSSKPHLLPLVKARVSEDLKVSFNYRIIKVLEWCAVAVLTAYLGGKTLPSAWHTLNTDFPNYYLAARLSHENSDVTRIFEWQWIQRQKDHRAIDQRMVGMVPLTPFSTLIVRPFASLPPLTAKHYWIIVNLILLGFTIVLLRRITYLPWRRILLVIALSFPLHRNLLYGQYYVLLLFTLSLACWLYIRHLRFTAGLIVGLGFGLKIFPILYLLYFLRKRDMRALSGGIVSCIAVGIFSVLALGWQVNRTYVLEVVPWALRGEGLDPYNLTASSFTSLLHRLFIYEPQWNPHPAVHAPWLFALMLPIMQISVIGTVLLLSSSVVTNSRQIRLEWAAMLLAILTISTNPASYLFTLLILPVCLLWSSLETKRQYLVTGILLTLYCVAGLPAFKQPEWSGWHVFMGVPRLYALIGLSGLACVLLWRQTRIGERFGRTEARWACGMAVTLVVAIFAGLRHQKGLYDAYPYRLEMPSAVFMAANPQIRENRISFIAMLPRHYQAAVAKGPVANFSSGDLDQLSQTTSADKQWIEEAGLESNIVDANSHRVEIALAEYPVASADGKWIAFLREKQGRANLWLHEVGRGGDEDRQLTSGSNVLETSFLGNELIFAAARDGKLPQVYNINRNGIIGVLVAEESRYPSVSPDGKWLAYSRMQRGTWNLWIRSMDTGQSIPITDAACNSIEPSWDNDSKTLIYASDCGRSLWFTALYKRRVIQ
jgi:hypothetical protein